MDNEECIICMDELNYLLPKHKCERCDFKCCIKCFDNLTNVECPVCKHKYFNIQFLHKTINTLQTNNDDLHALLLLLQNQLHDQLIINLNLNDLNLVYRNKLKISSCFSALCFIGSAIYIIWLNVN